MGKKNFIPISICFCVIDLLSYREILKKYRKRAMTGDFCEKCEQKTSKIFHRKNVMPKFTKLNYLPFKILFKNQKSYSTCFLWAHILCSEVGNFPLIIKIALFFIFQFSNYLLFNKSIPNITSLVHKKTAEERTKETNTHLNWKTVNHQQFPGTILQFYIFFRNYKFKLKSCPSLVNRN